MHPFKNRKPSLITISVIISLLLICTSLFHRLQVGSPDYKNSFLADIEVLFLITLVFIVIMQPILALVLWIQDKKEKISITIITLAICSTAIFLSVLIDSPTLFFMA